MKKFKKMIQTNHKHRYIMLLYVYIGAYNIQNVFILSISPKDVLIVLSGEFKCRYLVSFKLVSTNNETCY